MSVRDVNPVTVLAAINDGCDSPALLAERFEVIPASQTLRSAINDLEYHGHIVHDRKKHRLHAL